MWGPVPATSNVLKHYVDFVTGLALGNDDVSSQPFSSFLSGLVPGARKGLSPAVDGALIQSPCSCWQTVGVGNNGRSLGSLRTIFAWQGPSLV